MASELDKFRRRHQLKAGEKRGNGEKAAEIGAGTWGGLAAQDSLAAAMADRAQDAQLRPTRRWADFVDKLQPGDVLFHRRSTKDSAFFEPKNMMLALQKKPLDPKAMPIPVTEKDVMLAAKGDPYYHSSVYMGRGKVGDAVGAAEGIRKDTPVMPDGVEDIRVYRPKVSPRERQAALNYIRGMHGGDYADFRGQVKHGLSHLFNPMGGPKTSRALKDSAVCTELTANAYPSIFKDAYMSPGDMRRAEGLDYVARYNPMGAVSARDAMLTRGVYPLLKNLKWGVLAGAGAYAGLSLADYWKKHSKGPHNG